MAESLYFIEEQSSIKCVDCGTVTTTKETFLCYFEENGEGQRKTRRMCVNCGMSQLKRDIRKSQKLLKKLKKTIIDPVVTTQ